MIKVQIWTTYEVGRRNEGEALGIVPSTKDHARVRRAGLVWVRHEVDGELDFG